MQFCSIIFGMTQLFAGVGIAFGIWILDLQISRLNWHSLIPWLWQLFFLIFAGLGALSVMRNLSFQPSKS